MVYHTPLTFFRGELSLAGRLFRNTNRFDVRQPAIIVTGSWPVVKEQMPEPYATQLVWASRTQTDFRDRPEQVDVAVNAADAFLKGLPCVSESSARA